MASNQNDVLLAWVDENSVYPLHFEAALAQSGHLYHLEREGLVPKVCNPNPHHPVTEEREHDQWWAAHSTQARQYCHQMEQRQRALEVLHGMYGALRHVESEMERPAI